MRLILLGYRGGGKTTLGRSVAARMKTTFVDTDDIIIQRAGRSIREIFATDGEPAFRAREAEVVGDALEDDFGVVALGGGAVLDAGTRQRLMATAARRVYLSASPEVLFARIKADPSSTASRPRLSPVGSDLDEVRRVLIEREPLYHAVMTDEIDVTDLSTDQAIDALCRMIA